MMFGTAILLSLITVIATVDYNGPLFLLHRPLITGAMAGLVMGNFTQGLIIGATLELMWLGVTGIGGYTPPDTITGAIVGTAFGIMSGKGATAGVAIAVPIAVITQQLDVLAKTEDIYFLNKAQKDAEVGEINHIGLYHYLSLATIVIFKVVPVFLAVMLGGKYVAALFDKIPNVIMNGLSVAGGILPAIGFAMLLNMMLKKGMWVFLLIGFVCSAFGNMPTVGIAVVGVIVAYFYDMIKSKNEPAAETAEGGEETQDTEQDSDKSDDDEEDYDL
ncbi:PTS sugar transporter subunit IIC [Companilactobacillus halodurans]